MIRLKKSASNSIVREDDAPDLAIPDYDLVRDAIKAGKTDLALDFLEYAREQSKENNDSYTSALEMSETYLAGFGEEEVRKFFWQRYYPITKAWLSVPHRVEEALQMCTEHQRRHHASFTVKEEPDRYVVTYDPCGSGGRLRRTRSVGITKKAYPWSWGKAGIPYHCCHCCIKWEIIPMEIRGYPIKVNLVSDKPEDPCIQLFYKRPELIPEEYFTRVGMKKDMARIKK